MPRPQQVLHTLAHDLVVIGERIIRGRVYWRLRPNAFFSGPEIMRARVIMAAHLGRALSRDEHVHHINEDITDDRIENLEVLLAADHNRHHKSGAKHSDAARLKISASMVRAYKDGRRSPTDVEAACRNIADFNRRVAAGEAVLTPFEKHARNAALLEHHAKSKSLRKTGEAFGITPGSVWAVVNRLKPSQLSRRNRRRAAA